MEDDRKWICKSARDLMAQKNVELPEVSVGELSETGDEWITELKQTTINIFWRE